ncbi:hypothetical protein D3C75_1002830 [compost metagenome]
MVEATASVLACLATIVLLAVKYGIVFALPVIAARALTLALDPTVLNVSNSDLT